jgi:hypothetical protein
VPRLATSLPGRHRAAGGGGGCSEPWRGVRFTTYASVAAPAVERPGSTAWSGSRGPGRRIQDPVVATPWAASPLSSPSMRETPSGFSAWVRAADEIRRRTRRRGRRTEGAPPFTVCPGGHGRRLAGFQRLRVRTEAAEHCQLLQHLPQLQKERAPSPAVHSPARRAATHRAPSHSSAPSPYRWAQPNRLTWLNGTSRFGSPPLICYQHPGKTQPGVFGAGHGLVTARSLPGSARGRRRAHSGRTGW